jgi:hypothetical protein
MGFGGGPLLALRPGENNVSVPDRPFSDSTLQLKSSAKKSNLAVALDL